MEKGATLSNMGTRGVCGTKGRGAELCAPGVNCPHGAPAWSSDRTAHADPAAQLHEWVAGEGSGFLQVGGAAVGKQGEEAGVFPVGMD